MDVATVKSLLLTCFLVNYVILLVWVVVTCFVKWPFTLCEKLFGITRQTYNNYNFLGIVLYKAANILLFLVPFLAFCIVKAPDKP